MRYFIILNRCIFVEKEKQMGKVNNTPKNPYPKCFEPLFSLILYYFFIVFKNKYHQISEN